MPKTPLAIDVVSDVVCPFCLIGVRRLEQVLAETPDVDATVTFHPFLLDPATPLEGRDLRESLKRKFGGDPEQMFGRVEAMAKEAGVPLDFAKVRRYASTVRAHTLVRHAAEKGTQQALAGALFEAYFLEGRDIGDVDTLVALAEPHGFTAEETRRLVTDDAELDATRAEAKDASGQGISGVPFFVFGGKVALSGAQPKEMFQQAIARATASP
jgi:predicted DsbA family dithiol-disulfide isomerase